MSYVNLKTSIEVLIQMEIDKWNNGTVALNQFNQSDLDVLNSALKNLESMDYEKFSKIVFDSCYSNHSDNLIAIMPNGTPRIENYQIITWASLFCNKEY